MAAGQERRWPVSPLSTWCYSAALVIGELFATITYGPRQPAFGYGRSGSRWLTGKFMLAPYPEIKINQKIALSVSPLHTLHIEESGSPDGIPVIVLHDGPGLGSESYHRRLFDAERYRVIQFDQRGCGRSAPFAEDEHNSLEESVGDLAQVLEKLEVEQTVLVGFGWGARIAQEFAKLHKAKVHALVLCGYGFTGKETVTWLFNLGAPSLFPDEWDALKRALEIGADTDVLTRVSAGITDANELTQIQTAKAWAHWLAKISSFHINRRLLEQYTHPHNAIALTSLSCKLFERLNRTLHSADAGAMDELPGFIVHGRYDAVCPLSSSHRLHQSWPGSELIVVRDAGHSVHDPALTDALIRVIGQVADRIDGTLQLNG